MEQGYTFVWPNGREPYMINSEGDKIRMEVHDLIPYVYLGAKDYRPVPDHEAELVMKVLGLMGDSTASRTIYLDGERVVMKCPNRMTELVRTSTANEISEQGQEEEETI